MCDVCKYPEKTNRLKDKLSTLEFVSSQTEQLHRGVQNEDEDGYPNPRFQQSVANPGWMARRASGKGQLGATKRGVGFLDSHGGASVKKPRTDISLAPKLGQKVPLSDKCVLLLSLAIYLVTKEYSSATSLKKPFKTPFKTPFKVPLQLPALHDVPSPEVKEASPDLEISDDEVVVMEEIKEASYPESCGRYIDLRHCTVAECFAAPCAQWPEEDMRVELEVSFSQKIPADVRREGSRAIRQALQKTFMGSRADEVWSNIRHSPLSEDTRNAILSQTAQELEFRAMSLCTTVDGYKARADSQVDAVKILRGPNIWAAQAGPEDEDGEDARNVIEIMQRLCKTTVKNKGKGRET
ncbi:hypothetical protein HWV62_37470 [Athelia sp. TMB]|nr:hypothetical protein HWV62_37470 [Athelia sp. TMB]